MTSVPQANFNRYKKYSTDLTRYYRMPAVQASLSVVLSFFIAAFFILVALRPTFVTITKLKTSIGESQKVLAQLKAKAGSLQQISQEREKMLPLEKFLDTSIPTDGPHYQNLSSSMEILTYESHVIMRNMSIGDALTFSKVLDPYTGKNRSVIDLPFTIGVSGTYAEINDFFQKILTMDRLITFSSLSFTKDTQLQSDTQTLSFTISGTAHYIANESQLGPILPSKASGNAAVQPTQENLDGAEK